MGKVIIALLQAAENERQRRIRRELEERRRLEEERRRLEFQERQQEEEKRLEELIAEAKDWQLAQTIRSYVQAVEQGASKLSDVNQDKLMRWIVWAKEKADWLDPLVGRKDPLLGKRKHKE